MASGREKKAEPAGKLSPNELAIMNVLWSAERVTSKDLLSQLPEPMALTTLLTYLTRLEEKEYVRREEAGRGYMYFPAVPRSAVAGRLLDQVLAQFGGKFSSLVSHFVRTQKISEEERRRLRDVLDQLPKE